MRLLILLLTLSNIALASKVKICMTGTTVKQFPKYGEAFMNGAKLAAKEIKSNHQIEIKKFYYDRTALAPLKALDEMVKDKCHAIIGFSTGNDLFVVKDKLKEEKIFTASIYGDPINEIKDIDNLITFQPSEDYLLERLFKKVDPKLKKLKQVLIVTAVDRMAMNRYKSAYAKVLKNKGIQIHDVDVFEKTQNINNIESFLKEDKNFDAIVLLTRVALGAKIVEKIRTKTKQRPLILGTKYFGSTALPAFLRYLDNKDVEAYFSRHNCLCDENKDYKNFVLRYVNNYEKNPMVITANSYDLTHLIINAANNIKTVTHSNLLEQLKKQKFKGLTGISIEPGLKLNHSKSFILEVTKEGYKKI